MPKDSQPDNKKARMEKCNCQIPITDEKVSNGRKTNKKQSAQNSNWQNEP